MNQGNLWEITTVTDLVRILKEKKGGFVVVALTLSTTPKDTVSMIRKFLKTKSKEYPNVVFLYYNVNKKDFGKIGILKKNEDEYPYVYHIYDFNQILVEISCATKEYIYEAFEQVENFYIDDREKNQKSNRKESDGVIINKSVINKLTENSNNSSSQNNAVNGQDDEEDEDKKRQMEEELYNQQMMLERVEIVKEHANKFTTQFLKDIQRRKKD